jgi:hypothetical protein
VNFRLSGLGATGGHVTGYSRHPELLNVFLSAAAPLNQPCLTNPQQKTYSIFNGATIAAGVTRSHASKNQEVNR